jgi:hypothetical protein
MRDSTPQARKTRVEKLLQAFAQTRFGGKLLWALAGDDYPGYARYQERAGDRVIPVIAVEPR